MLNRVSDYIVQQRLLKKEGRYLVALSGGADSVALLLILKQLGYSIEAVHCNFRLRGEESDRDEAFVCQLCREQKIPLHRVHFDTKAYAALHKVSIEMAARELRYQYFEQLRQDIGADAICVAHHRDDAVETLLMNLMNGSGIHGLTGIRPVNGYVIRPLLGVNRVDIEVFLHSIGQAYVTDSSNASDDVLRNKIRIHLLPLMQEILPKSMENISKTANYIKEAETVYNHTIESELDQIVAKLKPSIGASDKREAEIVSLPNLWGLPSIDCFLFEWLRPFGFTSGQIQQICKSIDTQSGKTFHSAAYVLYVDRDALIVAPSHQPSSSLIIPEEGIYQYQGNITFKISFSDVVDVLKSDSCITVDKSMVEFPLTIRTIQPGDRFVPFGMKGTKLVSDYLTDKKVSLWAKRSQMVVADRNENVVWLVGHRIDNRFRVTSSTTSVLKIDLI